MSKCLPPAFAIDFHILWSSSVPRHIGTQSEGNYLHESLMNYTLKYLTCERKFHNLPSICWCYQLYTTIKPWIFVSRQHIKWLIYPFFVHLTVASAWRKKPKWRSVHKMFHTENLDENHDVSAERTSWDYPKQFCRPKKRMISLVYYNTSLL